MIKQLCIISALTVSAGAFGQAVPNGGFENWNNTGLYEDPEGWATFNFVSMFGAPLTATQSTDAHSGQYACKLETAVDDFDNDGTNDTLPGLMFLGTVDFMNEDISQGQPFTGRPDSLTGWLNYLPVVSDVGHLEVVLTRWNDTDSVSETVAAGYFTIEETTDWTRFSLPLEYYNEEMPDTVRMMIISNTASPAGGTALYVDDLVFVTNPTASTAELGKIGLSFYPNPSNEVLTVVAGKSETIEVYNALGKLVATVKANASEKTQIPTESYRNGVYFLKTGSGELHRFVVQH